MSTPLTLLIRGSKSLPGRPLYEGTQPQTEPKDRYLKYRLGATPYLFTTITPSFPCLPKQSDLSGLCFLEVCLYGGLSSRWAPQLPGSVGDALGSVAGLSTPVSAWRSRVPKFRTCRLTAAEPEAKNATARPPTATA